MRDLVYKHLTSEDKKRRIIACSEIINRQGVRSIITRRFVCILKEIKETPNEKPLPNFYLLKQRDNSEKKEKFFCRIKGSFFAIINGRLYLVLFAHSLKISVIALPQNLMQCSNSEGE